MQDDRHQLRYHFIEAWQKRKRNEAISSLEQQMLTVIDTHPEYHPLLDNPETIQQEYRSDNNPFLHMALHIGLVEQLSTNRPLGIRDIYKKMLIQFGDEHTVQHIMMDILGETIWEAQQKNQLPNDAVYLERLKKPLKGFT